MFACFHRIILTSCKLSTSDIAHDAFNGENNFENPAVLDGYSAVVGMFTEACHIVVRKDSDINSVDDFAPGKP